MSSVVTKIPTKLTSEFTRLFAKQKHNLELVLVTLILLDLMPKKLLGPAHPLFNRVVDPVVSPLKNLVQTPLFVALLFVVAVYSYYYLHDMNMFFILLLTLIANKEAEGYEDY